MAEKITVPTLGESVTEATVSKWLKSQGESVTADEPLVELETDKVNVEVPSPISGTLGSINVKEGETVNVGSLLGTVDKSSAGKSKNVKELNDYDPPKKELSSKIFKEEKITKLKKIKSKRIEEPTLKLEEEEPLILEQVHEEKKVKLRKEKKFSPAARKMASETKVDLESVEGSGKNGVILKEDIMSLMGSKPTPAERKIKYGPEERVKMTRLRLTIAKRLKEAQENAAMLTTFNEVDMAPLMKLRSQYKDQFEKTHNGTRLGFMGFFVRACCEALKRFPEVNASVDGNDVVYHGYQDIGVAVSTNDGLVVPVLRDADFMSIADVEAAIRDLGLKARDKKLTIDEMTGGTFTVSNGGVFGSLLSTPILNPPQTAILGMHTIKDRPVAVDGAVVIRPMMYLALSYDHRLIDGKTAVQFLVTVKDLIEDPSRILLQL